MLNNLLRKLGYKTLYFISYVGQAPSNGAVMYGSMNMTVRPYISLKNYNEVLKEVNKLVGSEVAVTCISKL